MTYLRVSVVGILPGLRQESVVPENGAMVEAVAKGVRGRAGLKEGRDGKKHVLVRHGGLFAGIASVEEG